MVKMTILVTALVATASVQAGEERVSIAPSKPPLTFHMPGGGTTVIDGPVTRVETSDGMSVDLPAHLFDIPTAASSSR